MKIPFSVKKLKIAISIFAIVLLILTIYLNYEGYFDPLNLCYVPINDRLGGNKPKIKSAISMLKSSDNNSYKTMCRNVSDIMVAGCLTFDPHVSSSRDTDKNACYIRGSKIVYVNPYSMSTQEMALSIAKYANDSKIFWGNQ